MTEKRFTLAYEKGNWWAVRDRDITLWKEEVVGLLNELAEENEQLKQRNNRQAKQLDHLYNLIEEKDWRTLNDIIDDFKRCEEQLHKEWRTYGDVE